MSGTHAAPAAERLIIEQMEAKAPIPRPVREELAVQAPRSEATGNVSSDYLRRTLIVWTLWMVAGFFTNGLVNWMPTLYRSFYGLPLGESLRAATLNNVAQIVVVLACALTIDRIGRKRWVLTCLVAGAVLMAALGAFAATSIVAVMAMTTLAYGVVSSVNAVLYLYTPEIYPTRIRARATGIATGWVRVSSACGQLLVGYFVAAEGTAFVFFMFAAVSLAGAVAATLMLETRNRRLEEIAA